jgi:primary-amine oxidase
MNVAGITRPLSPASILRSPRHLLRCCLLSLSTACAHPAHSVHPATAARAAEHPLEPLTRTETGVAFETLIAQFRADPALPKDSLRFPLVALSEPAKSFVLAWSPGQPFPRHAELHVLHYPSNRTWVAEVDLEARRVVRLAAKPLGTQPAVGAEEFVVASELVHAYEPWKKALRARGVDPELAYVDAWSAGDEPIPPQLAATLPFGESTRMMRCLTFDRGARIEEFDPRAPQNPYDRPVEGVVVTVDMNARRVIHMTDSVVRPAVIADTGNATSTEPLRPLLVKQPEGSDIQLRGHRVRWHRWQFLAVLHPREGLVLYDVRYLDRGAWRPIAYRLSLSEIYVPYGLGHADWAWRSALDVGEYNAGTLAQRLEVDRDVPENATLLDAISFSDLGPTADNPTGIVALPATIALYERDAGMSWTRTDPTRFDRDTRYARELVATWNFWVGNYIYAFEWIFKLDGSIDVRTHLTGTTLNRGTGRESEPSAPKVGEDARGVPVAAPNHQHFFSFRLDLDVDGPTNQVMEMEVARIANSRFKNAFDAVTVHPGQEGYRDANPFTQRHWHVESSRVKNRHGKPTGYALEPGELAIPYSAPDFAGLARAQFARHQLWMTRYRDGELHAAGRFPNQAKGEDGLPVFIHDAESLEGQDVVLWYTTGLTHLSRPEDYPVMPTESIGFTLAPRGFFERNPALDVADQAAERVPGAE